MRYDGRADVDAGGAVLRLQFGAARSRRSHAAVDRQVRGPLRFARPSPAVLQRDRASVPKHAAAHMSRDDFRYDHEGDVYFCPAGKLLVTKGTLDRGTTLKYRASTYDCCPCEMKPRCFPKDPARKVPRSIHEGARNMARDIAKTEVYAESRRRRKKVAVGGRIVPKN